MRKLLAALAIAVTIPATAQASMPVSEVPGWCQAVYNTAHNVMAMRQRNESMPDMLSMAFQLENELAAVQTAAIILESFNTESFNSAQYKEVVTKKFANRMYHQCIKQEGIFQ